MPSVEYDLGYLGAGVAELERYLLSKELYWPLNASAPAGGPAFQRLTLGGLLLTQKRLHAWPLNTQQGVALAEIEGRLDVVRSRWRAAWENKAAHDLRARLLLWRDFIEEYRHAPDSHFDRYAYEVRRRAMLQLLSGEIRLIPPVEFELLKSLDDLLRAVLAPGAFIWESQLAAGFPPEIYWYLYGLLKASFNT